MDLELARILVGQLGQLVVGQVQRPDPVGDSIAAGPQAWGKIAVDQHQVAIDRVMRAVRAADPLFGIDLTDRPACQRNLKHVHLWPVDRKVLNVPSVGALPAVDLGMGRHHRLQDSCFGRVDAGHARDKVIAQVWNEHPLFKRFHLHGAQRAALHVRHPVIVRRDAVEHGHAVTVARAGAAALVQLVQAADAVKAFR